MSKPWFTIAVAILSLFIFGHVKNLLGWTGGYIGYSLIFFFLGLLYSYSSLSPRIHIVVVLSVFLFNFYNLYTGSKNIYYPVPALGLAFGAFLGYTAGRLWKAKGLGLSVGTMAIVILLNVLFCNWLPSYFYNFRANLPVLSQALHKNVSLNFTDLQGNPIDESLWKNKVVIVDFWYLQCGWCREKILLLHKVNDHFKQNKDVQIISVIDGSIDTKEDVRKFLGSYKSPIPILYDPKGSFIKKYQLGTQGYPVEIKIDKKGNVQEILLGLWSFEEIYVNESIKRITALL